MYLGNLEDYESFQISRDDNSLEKENINLEKNLCVRLKKYIIKLRRCGDSKTFYEFKIFFEKELNFFIKILETRQLMSVVDTYIDYGNMLEKAIGIGISNFIFHEKMYLTMHCIYDFKNKNNINKDRQHSSSKRHSTHSFRLSYDDAIIVFLNRMSTIYVNHPTLNRVWLKILKYSFEEEKSCFKIIMDNLSEELKKDCKPLIDEILEKGFLSKDSLKKLDKIKKHSFEYKR